MHHISHRLGTPGVCSLLIACAFTVTPPAFCEPPPAANSAAQAAADDQSSDNSGGTRWLAPHFRGTDLPVSPRHGQPWTPPITTLPGEVVDAAKAVFDEGLADPRGCEYREIKVAVGNCSQGDEGVVATHGWVIPGKEGFAVCWNGLVYPVVSSGVPADLQADIQSLLLADQNALKQKGSAGRRENTVDRKWFSMSPYGSVTETLAVSYQSLLPFKAVLLLRLGEGELAAHVWSQWFDVKGTQPAEMGPEVYLPSATKLAADGGYDLNPAKDPYLWFARSWTWAEFDRAVCAHMRGDDHLALASARALLPIRAAVEAEAARRRFAPQGNETQDGEAKVYLEFLGQLPDLIADTERRLAEAPYTPVQDMKDPPEGAERIAALIRDLELVSARQWGQPGGVSLGGDPIVQALVQEGEPAVEPLLQCLEKDQRLTRSVHFWRDFSTDRGILGVHEAAYDALASILQTRFFGINSTSDDLTRRGPDGRRAVADSIRAFREKYGKLSMAQRWYEILRDPADPHWSEAVDWITRHADAPTSIASKFGGDATAPASPQAGLEPLLQGEPLRSMTDPAVSDLLIRRLHEAERAFETKVSDSDSDVNLAVADQVARALATWDGANQREVLRDYSRRLRALFARAARLRPALIRASAATYKSRVKAGDQTALDEYAAWLGMVPPDELEDEDAANLFRLAWMHPESPRVQQTVADLFAEKGNWSPVLKLGHDYRHTFTSLLATPLVGMAGFRAELLRGLRDKSAGGEVKITEDQVSLEAGGGGSYWSINHDSPLVPPAGTSLPFRVCDFYGFQLQGLPGAPRCELYWPEASRDEAIGRMVTYLETYGDNLQCGPDQSDGGNEVMAPSHGDSWFLGWPASADEARLGFPALDHPATADDVREHRAIFALEGERRQWKLPQRPMRVLWTTLQDDLLHGTITDASGKTVAESWYDQWAGAWQAEEALKDGRWERFVGVVSAHRVARVPAADIEFYLPDQWYMVPDRWSRIDHGFGGVLTVPHTQDEWLPSGHAYDPMPPGQPVTAALQVRDQLALDQSLPADLFQAAPDAKGLPPGVKLALFYSAKVAPRSSPQKSAPEPDELKPWTEVACRMENPSAASSSGSGTVSMDSLEARTVFQVDLRDFFDLSPPGSYRLRADIQRPGVLVGQSAEATFTIVTSP